MPGLRLEKQELLLRVQARVQRAFLVFLLEAIKVTTKLGRVSEASFCPATTKVTRGKEAEKERSLILEFLFLAPSLVCCVASGKYPLLPISGSRFPKDNPQP